MARERQRQLVTGDAAAVVAHAAQRDAARLDLDLDRAGARIETVLDQLLDDGRRPLDDLAGGDLVISWSGRTRMSMPRSRLAKGVARIANASRSASGDGGAGRSRRTARRGQRREPRARQGVLVEVAAHAVMHGVGDALLLIAVAQALFVAGFEMNAVSTSIDGISGDLSTTNPACCTRVRCTSPTPRSDVSTVEAASTLLLTLPSA
jgi:hypothetical protein